MKLYLVGMGPGSGELLTGRARQALEQADAIIGARRVLELLPPQTSENRFEAVAANHIRELIQSHPEWNTVAVALSGDVGFYSGAKSIRAAMPEADTEAICGISSPQYLCAKLIRPWQSLHLVSAHGLDCDPAAEVRNYPETFFLTDGVNTPQAIARRLCDGGLGDAVMTVGERLAYPDERITCAPARELVDRSFDKLNAVLVDNPQGFRRESRCCGIEDGEFIRGEVPMTKQEVRAAAMAKLAPRPQDVCWDVGAGTGSVSVEMALACRMGRVYAVEIGEEGCGLIAQNRDKFGTTNLEIIQGAAPQALAPLPAPDVVFVGGSKGNLLSILQAALDKNSQVRLVISAISLETLSAALAAAKNLALRDLEIVQIAASRTRAVGGHHMLIGNNPIFLICAGGREE